MFEKVVIAIMARCSARDATKLAHLAGRLPMGDDTRDAINGAPCAVAIAPDSYADVPAVTREIAVAYDESAEAEHALAVGRELATTDGARLSLFEAVTLPLYATNGGGVPDGFGPLGRLVHSSTSMQLARTARCPLLILTREARSPERVSSTVGSRAQTAALA